MRAFRALALGIVPLAASVQGAPLAAASARGAALYAGEAPLTAHLAGSTLVLPQAVVGCGHCHGAPVSPGSATLAAPDLRNGWLAQAISRRNGPPSSYTAASLCRTLRTGIDPVQILVPRAMPRYDIGDDDCAALWGFLGNE